MTFQTYPSRSSFIFLGFAVVSGLVATFLFTRLLQQNDLQVLFQLLVGLLCALGLTGQALYWTTIVYRLRYHLNRNGIIIQWGLAEHIIPVDSIQTIIAGKNLAKAPAFRGINIGGLRFGRGELAEYAPVKFHTLAQVVDSVLIVTPDQSYLISPRTPDSFLKAWRARQSLGPTQHWSVGARRSWPFNLAFLADPLTWWLLGPAAVACLAHFGYLSFVFDQLPPSLPIHFNAFGRANRIADKSALLLLPVAGALVLGFNALLGGLIYRREKVATYLLWGSTIVMQICLWVAMLTITA